MHACVLLRKQQGRVIIVVWKQDRKFYDDCTRQGQGYFQDRSIFIHIAKVNEVDWIETSWSTCR